MHEQNIQRKQEITSILKKAQQEVTILTKKESERIFDRIKSVGSTLFPHIDQNKRLN